MTIFDMANTRRHIDILEKLSAEFHDIKKKEKVQVYRESAALVYRGHRIKDPSILSLIDIEGFDISLNFDDLNYVQPDFMIFSKNEFIWNKNETRLAGCPDLIIEIWSKSDYPEDRASKFQIYSNSNNKTEHWYIDQRNNEIECYLGEQRLENQMLYKILRTKNKLRLDLRDLAL